jgi:hypothetical protein
MQQNNNVQLESVVEILENYCREEALKIITIHPETSCNVYMMNPATPRTASPTALRPALRERAPDLPEGLELLSVEVAEEFADDDALGG